MSTQKFTTRKDDQYGIVLQIDGKDSFCPFQTAVPVPMQSAMGGMSLSLMRMPCSSQCPFVTLTRNEDGEVNTYECRCVAERILKFFLDVEPKKDSNILRLL